MNKERINVGPDTRIETWRDGEWQIVYAESAGSKATVSLRDFEAWRFAYAMSPMAGQYFDRAREANAAVHELSYPAVRADELRQIAKEIDCGGGCENCSERSRERGEFCGLESANSLVTLADALNLKAKIEVERKQRGKRWRWFWYRALMPVSPGIAVRCLRPEEVPF